DERREKEELQRQKKSPYRSWVQMNKDAYKAEDWLMSKSPIAYRIFKFLINNMDSYNAVMCSQTVLQEQFDVSRVTISRAIKLLKEKQFIDVTNQEHQTFTQLINKSLGVVGEVTLNMENLVLTSFFLKVTKMSKYNLKYKNIKRYLLKIARKTDAIMIHSNIVHRGNHSKEKYLLARFQEWGKDDEGLDI